MQCWAVDARLELQPTGLSPVPWFRLHAGADASAEMPQNPASHACCRLTVEVADRVVQLEASGALLAHGELCSGCLSSAAGSCALLALCCPLSPADSLRVAAVAAAALGSGRSVLQAIAQRRGSALTQARYAALDVIINVRYCVVLATDRDIMAAFAQSVAPPARLLGWMRDAAAVLNRLGALSRAGEHGSQLFRMLADSGAGGVGRGFRQLR